MADQDEYRLGEACVRKRLITAEQLQDALVEFTDGSRGKSLGRILVERGFITQRQLTQVENGDGLESNDSPSSANPPAEVLHALKQPDALRGKYVILDELGKGGFGVVYRAFQLDLHRFVALKFLNSQDPEDIQRFKREAQLAAQLKHPNIVPIHEVGEMDEKHYIAMECIEGQPLDRIRLDPRHAVELIREVSEALQYAHSQGIIHRDLKPGNLLLGSDAKVRVLDFGLARQQEKGSTLTMSGSIVGTPSFIAPELTLGNRADIQSDVYSLGATLYQLVTGHPPFEAEHPLEVLSMVQTADPISPRKLNPKVPEAVTVIVQKAMEKDRSRRYATAQELADDLTRFLAGGQIEAKPAGPARRGIKWVRRHRTLSAVSVVLILVLVAIGGVLRARAISFRTGIQKKLLEAKSAERRGEYQEARDLYSEVRALDEGNPEATERYFAMDRALQDRAKTESAEEFLIKSRAARKKYEAADLRWKELRSRERRLHDTIAPSAGKTLKQPLWDLQREIRRVRESRALWYSEMIVALTSALGAAPKHREARRSLARIYYAEFLDAERKGDSGAARLKETLVLLFDDGTYKPKMKRVGTVSLDSDPPRAEVHLFRYETGLDRRLMPFPFDAKTGRSVRPTRDDPSGPAYPLVFSEANRVGPTPLPEFLLPSGSYLMVLRKKGFRDTRYPVLIGRGTNHPGKVKMYTAKEIGKGFVYVPGGEFIFGGGKNSTRRIAKTKDFSIGQHEVTAQEYMRFVNDRTYHSVQQARRHLPQVDMTSEWRPRGGRFYLPPGVLPNFPIAFVGWNAAKSYCDWKNRQARAMGERGIYSLPTIQQWEKGARGVDGRTYPWGNSFDWSFTFGGQSRSGQGRDLAKVGGFPKDESPFGAVDMSGSVSEWCLGKYYGEKGLTSVVNVKGGSYAKVYPDLFRVDNHTGEDYRAAIIFQGFRLVRNLTD